MDLCSLNDLQDSEEVTSKLKKMIFQSWRNNPMQLSRSSPVLRMYFRPKEWMYKNGARSEKNNHFRDSRNLDKADTWQSVILVKLWFSHIL